jgi:lysophospholipase L1-like esterase
MTLSVNKAKVLIMWLLGGFKLRALVSAALIAVALHSTAFKVQDPQLQSKVKVLFIGDSIVGGKGDDISKHGILSRLTSRYQSARFEAISLPGSTSAGLLAYTRHQLDPYRITELKQHLQDAHVVVISAGINDFWAETGPRRTVANLRSVAKLISCAAQSSRGTRPHISIATLIPTTLPAQKNWSDGINKLLVGLPAGAVGAGPQFHRMNPALLGEDGLHPSSEGYDWLAVNTSTIVESLMNAPLPDLIDCPAAAFTAHEEEVSGRQRKMKHRRPAPQ